MGRYAIEARKLAGSPRLPCPSLGLLTLAYGRHRFGAGLPVVLLLHYKVVLYLTEHSLRVLGALMVQSVAPVDAREVIRRGAINAGPADQEGPDHESDNTLFDWVDLWYVCFAPMMQKIAEIARMDAKSLKPHIKAVHEKHGTFGVRLLA